jgi:hypothetical protein
VVWDIPKYSILIASIAQKALKTEAEKFAPPFAMSAFFILQLSFFTTIVIFPNVPPPALLSPAFNFALA